MHLLCNNLAPLGALSTQMVTETRTYVPTPFVEWFQAHRDRPTVGSYGVMDLVFEYRVTSLIRNSPPPRTPIGP